MPERQPARRSSSRRQNARTRRTLAVDPRIERSRQVILQAVLDELSDVGYGALTIESAARRAGVGKATIYRHWPDKIELIADAFKLLQQQRDPELVTGSPREKLERVLRHVADVVADSPFSACLPALIDGAERDRAVRRFHHQFQAEARKPTIALIANGVASGDFPARIDPELAAFALLGAIFFCRLMTNAPFPQERVSALIDTVFGAND
ncbi:MAG: TetR/AcrR family transcriptional regulator [Xanthobacteraceae bacterium]|nr:TetR/AcrR family transcriptional regulator [Xanthobacteraceae bacterium]